MKSSILALMIFFGAFAQAAEVSRLVIKCDQKHGHHHADIYWTGEKFYLCISRMTNAGVRDEAAAVACRHPIWSEDWETKDDMIRIDFHRGWMYEGDEKGGVLTGRRTSFICENVPRALD